MPAFKECQVFLLTFQKHKPLTSIIFYFAMLKQLTTLILVAIATSACSVNFGQFTTASSMNVRGLDYDQSTSSDVEGSTCLFLFFGKQNGRIQQAMDNAIKSGRKKGLDGDMLVDVRIDNAIYPFVNCVKVTGTLVSLKQK